MSTFWDRRKAAVEAEEQAVVAAQTEAERAEQEASLAERPDEELLAEKGLKDPDTLNSAEEIRAFLSETLPQRLKTRALRRLWRLNPVLANLDGLVDYGEDFTDSAMVVENMQTAYQVGKGMLKSIEAYAAEAEAKANAAKLAEAEDTETDSPDLEDAANDRSEGDNSDLAATAIQAEQSEDAKPETYAHAWAEQSGDAPDTISAPSHRRMRFAFDGAST